MLTGQISVSYTEISLSGYNRGDEDDPNSCNGSSPGTSCPSGDD
jgi:hypothetical protein